MIDRLHIAVDMDDVILDFCGGVIAAVNREYGSTLTIEDITTWEIKDVLNPIIGESWWTWMRKRSWLWSNFDAMPGAIGALEKFRRHDHHVEIVTSKPEWAEHNVWQWLGKWKPPVNQVTIVRPEDRKVDHTEARLIIDDKASTVNEFAAAGRLGLLFDRPHNRADGLSAGVYRVHGWAGVLDYFESRGLA